MFPQWNVCKYQVASPVFLLKSLSKIHISCQFCDPVTLIDLAGSVPISRVENMTQVLLTWVWNHLCTITENVSDVEIESKLLQS